MKPARILIIQDAQAADGGIAAHVEALGHRVLAVVDSPDHALDAVRGETPDVAIIDLSGEKGEGEGKACAARCLRNELDLPVIAVTSPAAPPIPDMEWVSAPVDPAELKAAIELSLRTREITQRLAQSQQRYKDLVEGSGDCVWRIDLAGRLTFISQVVKDYTGYEASELIGQPVEIILTEESAREARESLGRRIRGDLSEDGILLELTHRRKDGTEFIGEVRSSVIFSAAGEVVEIQGITRDVSERKRFEEQMQQAQKLESLGIMAGGVAHDFNNLLMAMLGNVELALMDLTPEAPAREYVREIGAMVKRAAELTKQMLAYSGHGRLVRERISLSELIAGITELLASAIPKGISLVFELSDDIASIEGDPGQLHQVVTNLVSNASDAVAERLPHDARPALISVSTGHMRVTRGELAATYVDDKLPEGQYVFLRVSDTGGGMDEETQAKAFDPFFTTKFTGRGLGLAAVLGIVRRHRGAIKVDTTPGAGTTVTVFLPALPEAPEERKPAARDDSAWRGSGTILLVDDEEGVRKVVSRMLEKVGFTVLSAADGRAAVDLFEQQADEICCVLLDFSMPHMDGEETFHRIRTLRRETPVMMASGYGEEELARRFEDQGIAAFIQKPYRFTDLLARLRNMLEA